MIAFDLFIGLRAAGVLLESGPDGKLIAKAAAGVITPERRALIAEQKPALLAAIDLDRRIRTMAKRWSYSDDELAEVLEAARVDPQTWLRLVDLDERKFGAGEMIERWPAPPIGAAS